MVGSLGGDMAPGGFMIGLLGSAVVLVACRRDQPTVDPCTGALTPRFQWARSGACAPQRWPLATRAGEPDPRFVPIPIPSSPQSRSPNPPTRPTR